MRPTRLPVLHPVVLVSLDGVSTLEPSDVQSEMIGLKAFGLGCLPREWIPPFVVLDAAFVKHVTANSDISLLNDRLRAIDWYQARSSQQLIVRSSALNETIRSRGTLMSYRCNGVELPSTLQKCVEGDTSNGDPIHWLIQPYVEPVRIGHLSNERRIARAKRDWLLEFENCESLNPQLEPVPIAIRKWREGDEFAIAPLVCSSAIEIDQVLRAPAHWASDRRLRLHYEWVWDGDRVFIVQADLCEADDGCDPYSLLPKTVLGGPINGLKCFRKADRRDFETYRKLSNVRLYEDLGYNMPDFFVLDDRNLITELLDGNPSQALLDDIQLLVARPLVVRTDGLGIPEDDRQMLPRSDELRTTDAVLKWFKETLLIATQKIDQHLDKLVFLCHHYLPAAASAWSYAEPNKRIVRIEALWGIPEGMYWFSHDAYEVDTGYTELGRAIASSSAFRIAKRERYKEWYIAPDSEGTWRAHKTDEKHDWKGTLKDEWHVEIAKTTRRIADTLGYPVNLMWFLDVHGDISRHKILPWFHEKSELVKGGLKGSPRRKYSHTQMVEIRTNADLQSLAALLPQELLGVNRIAVIPSDPELIRNTTFVAELATFAKQARATIELSGGVLSHVFYMLSREGCAVEVVDLFGAREETLVFRKLVRDKIPSSIVDKGEQVVQVKLQGENILKALKAKLIEESIEASDSTSTTELIEELADVQEVLFAIAKRLGVSRSRIESVRKEKRDKRGGFDEAKVLVRTSAPGSLIETKEQVDAPDMFDTPQTQIRLSSILEPDIELHQDAKSLGSNRERFLEIEFPAVMSSSVRRVTEFLVPALTEAGRVEIPVVGEWALSRNGAQVRVRLSLRDRPLQGEFDFE